MLTAILLNLAVASVPADAPRVIFDVAHSSVQLVADEPKISNEQYVRESSALNATRESYIGPAVMLSIGSFFLLPGVFLTVIGAISAAAGGSIGASIGLVFLIIGIPPLAIGLGLAIPGLVLLLSRVEHNRDIDRQVQDLERRRLPPPARVPAPSSSPETVPLQVDRVLPIPLYALSF